MMHVMAIRQTKFDYGTDIGCIQRSTLWFDFDLAISAIKRKNQILPIGLICFLI